MVRSWLPGVCADRCDPTERGRAKQFERRQIMNLKSLLLGSAAALAAVSGAQAADAIVAMEPEPMEYVRVCDAFGTGYF